MDFAPLLLQFVTICISFCAHAVALWARLLTIRDSFVAFLYQLIDYVFPRRHFQLPKIPKHLGILLTEQSVASNQTLLCDLSWYCVLYGINELSIYDPWSTVVRNEKHLAKSMRSRICAELKAGKQHCTLDLSVNQHSFVECINHDSCKFDPTNNNSLPPGVSLRVNLLDVRSGRAALASITRKWAETGTAPEDITPAVISNELRHQFGVGEPDCLLRFGQTCSWLGYPPWTLRLTEFVQVPSGAFENGRSGLSELMFVDCLERFGKRQQRCGR